MDRLDIFRAIPVDGTEAGGGWRPLDTAPHGEEIEILTVECAHFERAKFDADHWRFPAKSLHSGSEVWITIADPQFWRPKQHG